VKIAIGKNKFKIIGNVYRPNTALLSDIARSLRSQEEMINLLKSNQAKKKCKIWLCGDFNLDLLNSEQHGPTKLHLDTVLAHNFFSVITQPTRVAARTATLTSHVFVKNGAKTWIPESLYPL
jgi:hypothetical protein